MPPVSSPGSRTALVTWSVVFAILFVVSAIFAIYFYADGNKAVQRAEQLQRQYAELASQADLQSDLATQLREVKQNPPEGSNINPQMTLLQIAAAQRDDLAHMIAGPAVKSPGAAEDRAKAALAAASNAGKAAKVTVPATDNLANALSTMASTVTARTKQIDDLQKQLEQAKQANAAQAQQFEQQRQELDKQVAAIRQEQANAQTALSQYQTSKNQDVEQIQAGHAAQLKQMQDAQNQLTVQTQELQRQLKDANTQISTLQTKLGENRINTQDPITRHADGRIIRMPARDVVYINLGQAESVTPGLTFEVYDKIEGIPPVGDPTTEDKLPRGKASIEVVRVGNGSSECRVVRQTPGTQMSEGDLIANLVYDPNVKYNFVVYGDFDVDRNNVATPQEADVIKRLITQWGGKIRDQVNVDTDFVVLGKEPVLPTFTKEELQDPFNAKKLDDAQRALDAYTKVRDTARDLHIPILNQNRFLYLIGYYDQSRR
jgi:predicted  nucleic acid-binding Zn-ribbon protein